MIVMMEDWQEGRADTHRQPVRTASEKCEIKNSKTENKIKRYKIGLRRRADTFHNPVCKAKKQKLKITNFEPNEELPTIFLFFFAPGST